MPQEEGVVHYSISFWIEGKTKRCWRVRSFVVLVGMAHGWTFESFAFPSRNGKNVVARSPTTVVWVATRILSGFFLETKIGTQRHITCWNWVIPYSTSSALLISPNGEVTHLDRWPFFLCVKLAHCVGDTTQHISAHGNTLNTGWPAGLHFWFLFRGFDHVSRNRQSRRWLSHS